MSREQLVARTFVELADTLVAEFDVVDVLHTLADRTVELLGVDAAGIILTDQRGRMQVVASTSHEIRVVELFALQNDEGPCLECFSSGEPVVNIGVDEAAERWPKFTDAALGAGYRSTHALPLHLRRQAIGAISLFCSTNAQLSAADVALGQALADVATISLFQERAVRQTELLAEQLQGALNSRILIEQAKGSLAARADVDVDVAFSMMRDYGRSTQQAISVVAKSVLDGSLDSGVLMSGSSN